MIIGKPFKVISHINYNHGSLIKILIEQNKFNPEDPLYNLYLLLPRDKSTFYKSYESIDEIKNDGWQMMY